MTKRGRSYPLNSQGPCLKVDKSATGRMATKFEMLCCRTNMPLGNLFGKFKVSKKATIETKTSLSGVFVETVTVWLLFYGLQICAV